MTKTVKRQVTLEEIEQNRTPFHRDNYVVRNSRFVGHDGFVVPKNFPEFYERFPHYVSRWVRKRLNTQMSVTEVEDWTQELLFALTSATSQV